MEDVGESMLEEVTEPVEVQTVEPSVEEDVLAEAESEATMTRPTALLKPIRGTLQPLVEEDEVRTARLTPVGHMLVPEKKERGPLLPLRLKRQNSNPSPRPRKAHTCHKNTREAT